MKMKMLGVVPAVALFVSPLAIGGQLSPTDSDLLFGKDKVAAKTISKQEMRDTRGQGHIVKVGPVAPGGVKIKVNP